MIKEPSRLLTDLEVAILPSVTVFYLFLPNPCLSPFTVLHAIHRKSSALLFPNHFPSVPCILNSSLRKTRSPSMKGSTGFLLPNFLTLESESPLKRSASPTPAIDTPSLHASRAVEHDKHFAVQVASIPRPPAVHFNISFMSLPTHLVDVFFRWFENTSRAGFVRYLRVMVWSVIFEYFLMLED